jgi:hypothetical protein
MATTRKKLADIGAPYFEGAERGDLVIPRCSSCRRYFFYPTVLCPQCHATERTWEKVSGAGSIYSYTVVYRPLSSRLSAPYVVAVIELDEGVRMMGNVLGSDPDDIAIGDRVGVTFAEGGDGRTVPMFERTPPASDDNTDTAAKE